MRHHERGHFASAELLPEPCSLESAISLPLQSPPVQPLIEQSEFSFLSPETGEEGVAGLDSNGPSSFVPDLRFVPLDSVDFDTNVDWIFDNNNSDYGQSGCFFQNTTNGDEDLLSQFLLMSAPRVSSQTVIISDDANTGEGVALGGLLIPRPEETLNHGDPWPLETVQPPLKHIVLPCLGSQGRDPSYMHGRYYNITPINDQTWHALQKCLRLPFEFYTLQTLNLDNFPTKEEIDQCIDLYFAHFQRMLRLFHQPTFDPSKDLVVTLAVICIGACYTQLPGAKAFSTVLSELNRRLLLFMAEHDRRFVRTQSYVAAQLLQGTRKFHTAVHLQRMS